MGRYGEVGGGFYSDLPNLKALPLNDLHLHWGGRGGFFIS